MGGVHEVHLPLAPAGLLQTRFQLLSQEDGLLLSVLLDASLSTWETVKNKGFLRKTVAENYGRRSQIAKNLGKSAILAC